MTKNNNRGFTLIETLIFLAVSSILFISVVVLVSGQVERTRAQDGARQIELNVAGVFNDVATGYYPLVNQRFSCSGGSASSPPTVVAGMAGENRGQDADCVIAGKKITFLESTMQIETLIASKNVVSPSGNMGIFANAAQLRETLQYPQGIKRFDSVTRSYYVLNRVLGSMDVSSGFVSGAQDVVVYNNSGVIVPSAGELLCMDNGRYKTSIVVAPGGSPIVQTQYQDQARC